MLSDLLRVVRLSGAVLLRGDLTAPWAVETPPAAQLARRLLPGARRLVLLHVVAEGHRWIALDDGERVPLPPGTLALLPYADAHVIGGGVAGEPVPLEDLLPLAPARSGVPVVTHGGGGAATRLVCGVLHCDELLFHPVLKTLPRLLVARPAPGAESSLAAATIRHLVEEAEAPQAGGACLRARLAELLFLDVLRRHLASLPPRPRAGWARSTIRWSAAPCSSCTPGRASAGR